MSHGSRVTTKGFYPSQRFCQGKEVEIFHHYIRIRQLISYQSEGNHPSKIAHLTLGHRMIGMIFKAWPVDLRYLGMRFQKLSNHTSILAMPFHAQVERFDATKYQETILRSRSSPASILQEDQTRSKLIVIDHQSSHHHIRVASQVLGHGVHHDVST